MEEQESKKNGEKFTAAVRFWEHDGRLEEIKKYFSDNNGIIYGLGPGNYLAHVLSIILKSVGFNGVKYSDVTIDVDNNISGFDPKQIEGEKLLAIRDGAITPGDVVFAQSVKRLEEQGIRAKSSKFIYTSPKYDSILLEKLLMYKPHLV